MRAFAFATLLLLAGAVARAQEAPDARVTWLRQRAIRLASLDPAHADSRDLAPLKALVGDARVVMLGEQSHGDGTAFGAKTRLIAYLHKELGFDVLAFESGLYDCHKAWARLKAGDDPQAAASLGIFGIWTRSAQVRPLIAYLGAAAKTQRPLELCGFDCQLTARASRDHLADDLTGFLRTAEGVRASPGRLAALRRTIEGLLDTRRTATAAEQAAGAGALHWLRQVLGKSGGTSRARFWRQFARSLEVQAHNRWAAAGQAKLSTAAINRRDAQMAENLLWLAQKRYPGRKIVVWAATFHIARNLAAIAPAEGVPDYRRTVPMGQRVHAVLGKAALAIGFTAYEGQRGFPWRAPVRIPTAGRDSFEGLCVRAGLTNAVIDLRAAPWAAKPLVARPLGYLDMSAPWSRVLDALVFTRKMAPSTAK